MESSPSRDTEKTKTRERILDAAERLLAEKSIHAVSTRMITNEANANSAALHYHFGTKEAVLRAIFERRLGPINAQRLEQLEELTGQTNPAVEDVLRAFILPTLALGHTEGERFFKALSSNISMDPNQSIRQISFDFYSEVGERFVLLIERICPHLDREELFWRLGCVFGSMMYIRADNGRLQLVLGEELSFADGQRGIETIVPFLAAGLRAPSTFPNK